MKTFNHMKKGASDSIILFIAAGLIIIALLYNGVATGKTIFDKTIAVSDNKTVQLMFSNYERKNMLLILENKPVRNFYFVLEGKDNNGYPEEVMIDLGDDGYIEAYFLFLRDRLNTKDMSAEVNGFLNKCSAKNCNVPLAVVSRNGIISISEIKIVYAEEKTILPSKISPTAEISIIRDGKADVIIYLLNKSEETKTSVLFDMRKSYFGILPYDIRVKNFYEALPAIHGILTNTGLDKIRKKTEVLFINLNEIAISSGNKVNVPVNITGIPCIIGKGKGVGTVLSEKCFSNAGNCPGGISGATFTSNRVETIEETLLSPAVIVQVANSTGAAYHSDILAGINYCRSRRDVSTIIIDENYINVFSRNETRIIE
ncbi:MAG: hypothetical protein QW331_00245 [Candidatus Woesearchaeota archaeon]